MCFLCSHIVERAIEVSAHGCTWRRKHGIVSTRRDARMRSASATLQRFLGFEYPLRITKYCLSTLVYPVFLTSRSSGSPATPFVLVLSAFCFFLFSASLIVLVSSFPPDENRKKTTCSSSLQQIKSGGSIIDQYPSASNESIQQYVCSKYSEARIKHGDNIVSICEKH